MTIASPPRTVAVSVVLFLLAVVMCLRAETVTLFPSADATLIELRPSNSIGAATWISAGTTQEGHSNRALLKFDVAAAIPAGSTITDAGLNIWVTRQPVDGYDEKSFSLRRVLRPWGEGTNPGPAISPGFGLPAGPGDATWSHCFFGTNTWSQPGGQEGVDYSADITTTATIAEVRARPYFFEGVGADVQLWLDHPESNFGWMLKTEEELSRFTARRFGSRELEDPFESPQLEITYLPPVHTQITKTNNSVLLSFNADVGHFYQVEARVALLATNSWTVLTNFGLVFTTGTLTATDSITNAQRFYRVRRD
jgi:hypothetical protein